MVKCCLFYFGTFCHVYQHVFSMFSSRLLSSRVGRSICQRRLSFSHHKGPESFPTGAHSQPSATALDEELARRGQPAGSSKSATMSRRGHKLQE